MLLVIDLGNTSAHFGLFQGKKLIREWRIETSRILGYQDIRIGRLGDGEIGKVVVSSVVPRLNKIIRKKFPKAVFVTYKNIGLKIKVRKPAEVGADRLVNALAAYQLYGGPAIVVDFGTATTFDVVSSKGEYLGGVIAPGILLARDSLYERTAKLPKIRIEAPRKVIGNTTLSAMQSGLVFGYVAMVEGMIERIKSNVQCPMSNVRVIATGGLAKLICKYTKVVDRVDPKLTLKGLRLVESKLE